MKNFKKLLQITILIISCSFYIAGCQTNKSIENNSAKTPVLIPSVVPPPHTQPTEVSGPLITAGTSNSDAITANGAAHDNVVKANGHVSTATGLSNQQPVKDELGKTKDELDKALTNLKTSNDKQRETEKLLTQVSSKFDQLTDEHRIFIDSSTANQTKLTRDLLDALQSHKEAAEAFKKQIVEKEDIIKKFQDVTTQKEVDRKHNAQQAQQDWWIGTSHWCFIVGAGFGGAAAVIGFLMGYIGNIAKPLLELAIILATLAVLFGAGAMGISMHIEQAGIIGFATAGVILAAALAYLCIRLKLGEKSKIAVEVAAKNAWQEAHDTITQKYSQLEDSAKAAIEKEKAKLKTVLQVAVSDVPGDHGTLDLTKPDDWNYIGANLGHEVRRELMETAKDIGISVPK